MGDPGAPGARLSPARVALLLPAGAALLLGLDAALLRLDLPAPLTWSRLPEVHGLLLVLGFVGALVALERAVALGSAAGYLAPVGLGGGGLTLVSPLPPAVPGAVLTTGAGTLVWIYLRLWRRQPAAALLVEALGAVLALGACLLWAGGVGIPTLLPWLAGFLVLTIAGERLELARIAIPRAGEHAVLACCGALAVAAPLTLLWPAPGTFVLGAAVAGLAGCLLRWDVARTTVRGSGLPRFCAACLLAGYGWLVCAGAIWIVAGPLVEGPGYDAVVHAVFLGFVLSMIMAHAPVILPAVLRVPLPYRPAMYAPVALLHVSLAARLLVGDAHAVLPAWQAGSVANAVAVLAFLAVAGWSAASVHRADAVPAPPQPSSPRRAPTRGAALAAAQEGAA